MEGGRLAARGNIGTCVRTEEMHYIRGRGKTRMTVLDRWRRAELSQLPCEIAGRDSVYRLIIN